MIDAKHARNRVTVDIGVNDAHRIALRSQCDGEVSGDGRFANAAFARRNRNYMFNTRDFLSPSRINTLFCV